MDAALAQIARPAQPVKQDIPCLLVAFAEYLVILHLIVTKQHTHAYLVHKIVQSVQVTQPAQNVPHHSPSSLITYAGPHVLQEHIETTQAYLALHALKIVQYAQMLLHVKHV